VADFVCQAAANCFFEFDNTFLVLEFSTLFLVGLITFWKLIAVAETTTGVATIVSVLLAETAPLIITFTINFKRVFSWFVLRSVVDVRLNVKPAMVTPIPVRDVNFFVPPFHHYLRYQRAK
jgi:hypothetical protein